MREVGGLYTRAAANAARQKNSGRAKISVQLSFLPFHIRANPLRSAVKGLLLLFPISVISADQR